MSVAEQKIREQLAAANGGVIGHQHEGENVVRWLTGGLAPSIHVTFRHDGNQVVCCCPQCGQEIGRFDDDYGRRTGDQILQIRQVGSVHQC